MATSTTASVASAPRLKSLYNDKIRKELKDSLELNNVNEVPKITKVIISVGLGRGKDDKRLFDVTKSTLRKITGQEPVETMAKKSIANFKIRAGLSKIGIKVTLRDQRMYEFLDRLITVVLPRVRDFHGVKINAFDANGNYSLGLTDQSVFPELGFEDTTTIHGLQITVVMNTKSKQHAHALLTAMGMPFEKKELK